MLQHLTEQNKFTVGNNQKKIEEKYRRCYLIKRFFVDSIF